VTGLLLYAAPVADEKKENKPTIPVYNQLSKLRFSQQPIPVPAKGITLRWENASWFLEKGFLHLMEPTPGGRVTGLIFKGKGHFLMSIPDVVEREHLVRCTGKNIFDEITTPFSVLIIRTPEPLLKGLVNIPQNMLYERNTFAANRHRVWLKRDRTDVNARVTAGLMNPGDEFLRVEMDTETFGTITYVFDKYLLEEIQIRKLKQKNNFPETWVSLDRASDRDKSGRPGSNQRYRFDMISLDIEADLSKMKLKSLSPSVYIDQGMTRVNLPPWWIVRDAEKAYFKAKISFTPTKEGMRMVELRLPRAKITGVLDNEGNPLPFIRTKADRDSYDPYAHSFWVLLDKPCRLNEIRKVVVVYRLELLNFAEGGTWYPHFPNNRADKYIVHLTAKQRAGYDIRAVGQCLDKTTSGKYTVSRWSSRGPVDLYGFTVFKDCKEERIKVDGAPEVVVYGDGPGNSQMLRNVAIDISNSLGFYQRIFGIKIPQQTVRAARIESSFGQALPGYLLLSHHTFREEHPGASELFRAHEAAHLYWGYMVDGKTYRDAWLSEAFAEYSAMLFVQAVMPKKKHYKHIVEGFTAELFGSMKTMFSKYSMPWQLVRRKQDRLKMGPISLGFRASAADMPIGYQLQVYHKGALVMHMLRTMMRNTTGNDRFFLLILKEYLHTYKGKKATTDDFKAIIEKRTKKDWSWFFNQWVHGTAIPTYSWNYKVKGKDKTTGKTNVVLTVKQNNVPGGFRMPVPIRVYLKGGKIRQFNLPINKKEQSFNLSFAKKIKKIIFNADQAVIAKIKKR